MLPIHCMPTAAPKPCTVCGTLVRDGGSRCPAHAQVGKWGDDRRGSRQSRGYGADWERLRERILRRDNGLCTCDECRRTHAVRAATEVDHRISKALWQLLHGSLAGVNAESNLGAINHQCHKAKTQREAQAARQGRLLELLPAGHPQRVASPTGSLLAGGQGMAA